VVSCNRCVNLGLLLGGLPNFPGFFMQFIFIQKSRKFQNLGLSTYLPSYLPTYVPRDPNLGLTELMYITELVNPGGVKLNGAVFCAVVSVFIAMYSRL